MCLEAGSGQTCRLKSWRYANDSDDYDDDNDDKAHEDEQQQQQQHQLELADAISKLQQKLMTTE